jgi:hypothetical protein
MATMQVGDELVGAVRMWATLMLIVVVVAIIAHWLFDQLEDTRWSSILSALHDVQRFLSIHGLS